MKTNPATRELLTDVSARFAASVGMVASNGDPRQAQSFIDAVHEEVDEETPLNDYRAWRSHYIMVCEKCLKHLRNSIAQEN